MKDAMPVSSRTNQLLIWCLSAFQTAGLVLVLVTLIYVSGDLGETLDGLNTGVGLGLYGVLWATNWWATRRAIEGLDLIDPTRPVTGGALIGRGLLWGGVNGVLFLVVLLVPLLLIVATSEDATVLGMFAILAYLVFIGGIASFIVGSVIGLAFASIEWTLLKIAHALGRVADDAERVEAS
jgi:hypothetical protein